MVILDFNGDGTDDLRRDLAGRWTAPSKQFAIVLDGQVISAPTMNGVITNGQAADQRQLHRGDGRRAWPPA